MRWTGPAVAVYVALAAAGCGGDGAPAPAPRDPALEFARSLSGTWGTACRASFAISARETWTFGDTTITAIARTYAGTSCSPQLLIRTDRLDGTFVVEGPLDETLDGHDITAYSVEFTWAGTPRLTLYVDETSDPDQLFLGSCGAWDCDWSRPSEFSRQAAP